MATSLGAIKDDIVRITTQAWGSTQSAIPANVKQTFTDTTNKIVTFMNTQKEWFRPVALLAVAALLSSYVIIPIVGVLFHYIVFAAFTVATPLLLNSFLPSSIPVPVAAVGQNAAAKPA